MLPANCLGTRRSRGGCKTCKKRKRKCDEKRPFCTQCQRIGTTCGGYEIQLRWGTGIASRCRFTGAALPLKDATPLKPTGRKRDRERKFHRQALEESHVYGHEDEAEVEARNDTGLDFYSPPSNTGSDDGIHSTLPSPRPRSFELTSDSLSGERSERGVTLGGFTNSGAIFREFGSYSSRTAEDQMLFQECRSFV